MSCRLRPKNLLQIEKGKHLRGTDTIQFGDDRAFGFSTRGSPRTGKRTKGCCDKRPDEKGPEQLQCRMVRRRRFQHQFYVPPGILPGRFMGRIFTAEKCVKYLVLLATPAGSSPTQRITNKNNDVNPLLSLADSANRVFDHKSEFSLWDNKCAAAARPA